MKWIKLGKIFDPTIHLKDTKYIGFAQSPQTIVFDDFVRIYFSSRVEDKNKKFLSHIIFVDIDKEFKTIINRSIEPVIELGGLGCFDEHGIFPINPLKLEDKIYAYTCGWSRRVAVSVETATGLAISHDNGLTFEKVGNGPILSASLHEPVLVGDSFVKIYNDIFHMWYIFGTKWIEATESEPTARVYKIGHITSKDGFCWEMQIGKAIITDTLGKNECQALPTVIKIGERYHMYFCYRYATDFRKNANRGYQLGYAYSDDLVKWIRNDNISGIELSDEGWDSEMMCYPHIFECDQNIYLLYNGNEFGKYGFGLAKLEAI